jgi:RNA polymerase sigma-70 factor (ECF subfamily)
MTDEDDAVQVALCLKGDASAFEPMVARYQQVLFNVALRMVGDREDAPDITQIAFVKAWEHRPATILPTASSVGCTGSWSTSR